MRERGRGLKGPCPSRTFENATQGQFDAWNDPMVRGAVAAARRRVCVDGEVAAGPVGVGTKAATVDVLAFSRTKGLFAGASAEGAIVAARDGWNEEYYRRSLRPLEILMEHRVTNPRTDPLREALTRLSGGDSEAMRQHEGGIQP